MSAPNFKTHDHAIVSLDDYLDCVKKKREECGDCANPLRPTLLFRGQQQPWKLLPKLSRYDWKAPDIFQSERSIVDEFWKMESKIRKVSSDIRYWEKVAIAQHYGLPTRLMDWTKHPAVALWFAVKDGPAPAENGKPIAHGEVWILRTAQDDYLAGEDMKLETPFHNRGRTRILDGGGYDASCDPRIDAQRGFFTVHAAIPIGGGAKPFIALECNSNFNSKLLRVPISRSHFTMIQNELFDRSELNEWTMFLDRDNASRFLIAQNTIGQRDMLR